MDCEKLICTENSTIKDVMSCIDSNAKGTAFIVDENKKLVGIVTDGDIRRALLNGAGLKEIIKTYMNNSFIYASDFVDAQRIFQKYEWKIKIIPLLDKQMHVMNYAECKDRQHVALAQPQLNGNEYNYLMDAFLFQ